MTTKLIKGACNIYVTCFIIFAGTAFTINVSAAPVPDSQPITIQEFQAPPGSLGQQVTSSLPIYKVHVVNGQLVDDSGRVFNSYQPQSTTPVNNSRCEIRNLNWLAFNTTFYVVLANDHDHMLLVRSCGKSPLQLRSTSQYSDINQNNFINHAQIAGTTNGNINKVIAAGELDVINGKIVYIDTCSGHFKPNVGSFLAFAKGLDDSGALALTSSLKNIISRGSITKEEILENLIDMKNNGSIIPTRNVRSGTSECYSYTTVFTYSTQNGTTTLSDGLLALNQGNINVFQNNINTITNKNIKAIELTRNFGFYDYSAYVTTDWHIYNNALDFKFTDETNDTYDLSIHVYSYNHAVDYDSAKPNIRKITFDWTPE